MDVTTETFYDAEQKIWSGPKRAAFYEPQATLGSEILKYLKSNPNKVMQVMDQSGLETTAAELLRDSQLIASEFLKLTVKPGDVIGIYAGNTCNLAAVTVASLLCGTPWNAIHPEFDEGAIKQMFELTTPKIICCDLENYDVLKRALKQMKSEAIVYIINGKISNVCSVDEILKSSNEILTEESFPGLHLDGDATAAIICSSGTTGYPKGVSVSHRTFLNYNVFRDINSESVLFGFSTLLWISGAWNLLTSLLHGAKRIVTSLPSTPENLLNTIAKHSVTHALISTTLITQLVQESTKDKEPRLDSLHCLCYGGSKAPEIISEKLNKLFNINPTRLGPIICYGMSELGGMLSETYTGAAKRRFDTVGKLMPNMEVRIADRVTGASLGANESGFILARLPFKWAGYFRNLEATKEVYENGWLNTCDLGYFDDEGYLNVTARESEIFSSNAFKVFPSQLEDIIIQMPGIAEVCVFGVPDFVATNLIACAAVRLKNAEGAALSSDLVVDYAKQHVAKMFQLTGGVYFLEELPKTASGKLLRRRVYDLIKNENA